MSEEKNINTGCKDSSKEEMQWIHQIENWYESREWSDSLLPLLTRLLVLSGRVFWTTGRAIFLGCLILATIITDKRRHEQLRRWFFLEGDRWTVVGLLVGGVFVTTLILTFTNILGISEGRFVTTMFSTIIAGLFSFVPIVIAVNQLTVSQIVETPDGLRKRIDGVHKFRVGIEQKWLDSTVTPTEPALFLAQLSELVSNRATTLENSACTTTDEDSPVTEEITKYVQNICSHMAEIDEKLDNSHLPLIEVLIPIIGDDYSEMANIARRLQQKYNNELTENANDLLDDLRELSISLDVLRQYFKALYIQQELSSLSRLIAISGTISFLISMFLVMLFATGDPSPHSPVLLRLVVSLGLAVAFAPLAILLSFMLRVATIAKQTAAPGAFTPKRETPDYVK